MVSVDRLTLNTWHLRWYLWISLTLEPVHTGRIGPSHCPSLPSSPVQHIWDQVTGGTRRSRWAPASFSWSRPCRAATGVVAQNRCVGVSSKGVSEDKVCFYLLGVGCQQGQDIFEENDARKSSPTQNATQYFHKLTCWCKNKVICSTGIFKPLREKSQI